MADATLEPPSGARSWLQGAASVALVAFLFGWALPRLADYEAIWSAIRSLSLGGIGVIAAAAVVNLLTYWWLLVAALPGLTYPKAAIAHQASSAVAHTMPAGGAVGVGLTYAMYASWGFAPGPVARSVLLTGLWNNLAKFVFPVVALALLAFGGEAEAALVASAAFGLVLLVGTLVMVGLGLRSDALARRLGRAAQAVVSRLRGWVGVEQVAGWDEAAGRFRADAVVLLRERGPQITVATLASHSAIFIVLLASLRALGVSGDEVSWVEALAAFSFVRLASALPVTPGGLGIVELGLLAVMTSGLGEGPAAEVAAAILLFRFVTYVLPVVMGGAAYVWWRHSQGRRGAAPPQGALTP